MSLIESRAIRLVTWRVLPLLMIAQLLMNLDRSAISFAGLDMMDSLSLSPEQFGFAAGIFFWGYLLFEVPSNFALRRFGPRMWIGRILITWGLVTILLSAAFSFESLAVMRFLLGAAEAGLTPGTWYLFTRWFPQRHRAGAVSKITLMSPIASVIGGPIAAAVLPLSLFGLEGWRWLFITLGAITVLFAAFFYLLMPTSPDKANWLSADERGWLTRTIDAENSETAGKTTHTSFLAAIKRPAIWGYSACYFFISVAIFGIFLWLPQVIKLQFANFGSAQISLISAVPYIFGVAALLVVGRTSDRTGDRRWHLVIICAVGATAFLTTALATDPTVRFVTLCVGVGGVFAYLPAFWPNPMSVLTGSAAVGGLALINSLGTFGGFFGPNIVGVLRGLSGSFQTSLAAFAVFFALAGVLPLVAPRMFPRAPRNTTPKGVPPIAQSGKSEVVKGA
ncbi:MFS transporter [Rhodococcus sp. NPDC059968]|uniref:MFS transporter n=1 Tax=Rhodococcus sp. NPDC059968 TaxID=3347017 RepID=UPI00366C041A